jgi:transposase-like protein
MSEGDTSMKCPDCGKSMILVEKCTMSGEDLRTYRCDHCDKEHDVNLGTALWTLMSDANKPDAEK